jgi:hypothetical protein
MDVDWLYHAWQNVEDQSSIVEIVSRSVKQSLDTTAKSISCVVLNTLTVGKDVDLVKVL